jgi:ABC-type phosphate transport system substrate-binding protein
VVSWGETVQALAALFGQHVSSSVLAVLAVATIAAPVVDRFVIRRKRIHYRVLYNSKIGLSPIELHDGDVPPADPQLIRIARLVDRMSIAIIRIRNTGSFDIEADDFAEDISFTFGKRIVWDARISEAPTKTIRQRIRNNLVFLTDEQDRPSDSGPTPPSLGTVRERLGQRLANWVTAQPAPPTETDPQWHGVRLSKLNLQRGQKFKLVVVLREPDDESAKALGDEFTTTKEIGFTGSITNGRIKDEKQQRRITWPLVTTATGLLLAGALVTTLVANVSATAGGIPCASGDLQVKGSSAFTPMVRNIADEYNSLCGTAITVQPTGGLDGLRELAQTDAPDRLAVLSDGPATGLGPEYVKRPVAVVVYAVVTNGSVRVQNLSTEDLRKIFTGEYQDWSQLGGPALPIRIVGRGSESGSRKIFEREVLGAPEEALSSDSCEARDRQEPGQPAKTTRCERTETQDAIAEIAATPGAIGYAASRAISEGRTLEIVELDGRYPEESSALQGYRFQTVEYLYTKGNPPEGGLLDRFIGYLGSNTGRAELHDGGYAPCIGRDGLHPLCR